MLRKIFAVAALAFGGVLLAGPAGATPAPLCALAPSATAGVITNTGAGKGVVKGDAVELSTVAVEDASVWKVTLGKPVTLTSVTSISYAAIKDDSGAVNAAAMPALRIYLDNAKTLYLEPYYQTGHPGLAADGNPKREVWHTYEAATSKLWQTGEGGGSYAGNRTLTQFKALYPTAKVVAVGVGQGTYNAGTTGRFKAVKLRASQVCVGAPSSSSSASASASGTRGPITTSASRSNGPVPVGAQLPITGVSAPAMVGVGLLLIGGGAVLLVLAFRNRPRLRA